MLFSSKSLTIERPTRPSSIFPVVLLAVVSLALSLGLSLRGSFWLLADEATRDAVSWPTFAVLLLAALLFLVAIVCSFVAYAGASIYYRLDRSALTLRWGPLRYYLPIDYIQEVIPGWGEQEPRPGGLSWFGHHVGWGEVSGMGEVLFLSTHRSPEQLVYVRTPAVTYGISPRDGLNFAHEVKRYQQASQGGRSDAVWRHPVFSLPFWGDRVAVLLVVVSAALNIGLFGYTFVVLPGLAEQITIAFPPLGEVTSLNPKLQMLKIPGTALAILAVNLFFAVVAWNKERVVSYLLLSGSVLLQVLFWVAIAVAITNA